MSFRSENASPADAAAPDGAERPGAGAPTMDVGEFYRIVASRLKLLPLWLALTFAIALAYIFLAPTRYTAAMSILIDPRERVPVGVEAQAMPQNPDAALVESQMRVMTSHAVLRAIVERENLAEDPDFKPGIVGQLIAQLASLISSKPKAGPRLDDLAEALGKEVSVKRSERSYIVDVEVKGKTPEKAERLARAFANAYFEAQSKAADDIVEKQTLWLDARVKDLKARVEAAERRAQDYRNEQGITLSEGRLSTEQQLKDANTALVAAKGKRAEVEARYDELKAAMARGAAADSVNDAIRSPVIEKLRADYAALARDEAYARSTLGPMHPAYQTTKAQLASVKAQIESELKRIRLATERELLAARKAESAAEKLVTNLETTTNRQGGKRNELVELEREAATLRASYEKALAQRENVRKDVVISPLGTLVDPPVAGVARTSPKTTPALLIAFAAGVNLWIVSALVGEYVSRMRGNGGFGFFAAKDAAPAVRGAASRLVIDAPALNPGGGRRPVSIADALQRDGPFAKRMSAAYDEILRARGEAGATPFLALASLSRGAGVSTLTLGLAQAAAARGQRALVIDRDEAHPTASALVDDAPEARAGGLFAGARQFARDPVGGGEIFILPLDAETDTAAETSARRPARPDLVLIDCGPLDAAQDFLQQTDALDGFLLVIERGADLKRVERRLAEEGLAQFCLGLIRSPVAAPER
jgi:polysaccharide biosynthesis transport protein